jgi:hypothetical protein
VNHAEIEISKGAIRGEQAKNFAFAGRKISGATIGAIALVAAFFLASCGAQMGSGQHATITMRDGTTQTGTITASSPTEVALTGDDNVKRTIPMTQVKSIEYDDAQAAQTSAQTSAGATPSGSSAGSSGATAAPARRRASKARDDAAHEEHYHPTQDEIQTKTYVLAAGTKVAVRTEENIDSGKAVEGQTFAADISDDLLDANGDVVVPRGANAQIVIKSAAKGGRFKGQSDLVLDLQSIAVGGKEYVVSTTDLTQKGKQGFGANKRTGVFTGGGAALGAIIGAIAGGGKGAAIGAGAGAGAGAVTQIATKGGSIKVPAETVLTFELDKPVKIVEAQ